MEISIALLAGVSGYLLGSISFAHLISRLAAPGREFKNVTVEVPGIEGTLQSDTVSATTVRMNVGPKWGCLVSILDMVKAAVPMLAFKLWLPDQPYYLIAGLMVIAGHNWPVFFRFQGGRGLSPVLGGFLVLDWAGTLLMNLAGFLLGLLMGRNTLVIMCAGIVLMIPWIWFSAHDPYQLVYVILSNVLFWYSMIPELKEYNRLRKEGTLKAFNDAKQFRVIHPDGSVSYDSATLGGIFDRLKERFQVK